MIERLVGLAVRHRFVVFAAALLAAVLGAGAFRRLPIEAYPDVADTWVQIVTQWPGHAPEEVEQQISIPMERVMNGVPRRTAIRSVSIAGLSVVTLVFEDGTDSYFARQQVTERLGRAALPDGVVPALGPLASPVGEILRYRLVDCATSKVAACAPEDLTAQPRSLGDLVDLEEYVVERELLAVDGVADVVSFGGTVREYHVLVDPTRLAAWDLVLDDVEKALAAANGNAGGGVVRFGGAALGVRGVGLLRPEQIGDVAVATRGGTPILVRHLARVEEGHKPRLGRVSVDGDRDVVSATVLLRKGEQADAVLARVHTRIADVNARVLPRGVKLVPYYDRTDLMQHTTRTVLRNVAEGVLLVSVVLLVFLGNVRAGLVVCVTIPLALLVAFVLMDAAKIPANLLSIGAIDFGMIVDGAIVVVENVHRRVVEENGHGARELVATVRAAASEVARPVVFAIAIIVTAYLPIFLLERVEGKLFSPMAWTAAFALGAALVLAVTLVPALSTVAFRGPTKEHETALLRGLSRAYLPLLRRALGRPRLVLALGVALLAADAAMVRWMGSEFLPHLDEGAVWMRASMPTNVSFTEATALVDGVHGKERDTPGIREIVARYPEVQTMAVQLGRPDDGTDPTGFYNAEFLLVLRDRSAWRKEFGGKKDALLAALARDLAPMPGVSFGFSQPISDNVEEALTGVKGQLAVKIVGDDLHALEDLAEQVARNVAQVPGVVDLAVVRQLGQSNVQVVVARDRAERFGMTVKDVEDVVEKGIGGAPATQIVEGERRHDLVVRYEAGVRDDVDAMRRLLIPLPGGNAVPLSQVADVRIAGGASRIFREDNRRYIAIRFGVRDRDLVSAVDEAQARVAANVRVPPGYAMTWGGEFESARRASRRLAFVIPATLGAIFLLLVALFRRTRQALVVLANVLLTSPVGGLLALLVTGTPFSVSAGVGFLALFGVSVQTGVILVSSIEHLREEGVARGAAILAAAERRLRPMTMTALVATLGLLPAALSTGIGSDSQKPLAIVVVGGLVSSLVLSLFVLPLLYASFGPKAEKEESA
jgi:cobalt-zinc-cadmium resistance protein CzcA